MAETSSVSPTIEKLCVHFVAASLNATSAHARIHALRHSRTPRRIHARMCTHNSTQEAEQRWRRRGSAAAAAAAAAPQAKAEAEAEADAPVTTLISQILSIISIGNTNATTAISSDSYATSTAAV